LSIFVTFSFVADINSGFRLLNLKNDGLRKRFDSLKYDVKKIEEIVYDLSIRGLLNNNKPAEETGEAASVSMKED
jgi:Translin family